MYDFFSIAQKIEIDYYHIIFAGNATAGPPHAPSKSS